MNHSTMQQKLINELVSDQMQLNVTLREAVQDILAPLSQYGLSQAYESFDGTYNKNVPILNVPARVDSRDRGEQIPVYLNTSQLKVIRDNSRVTCYFNEFAICGLENRVNYAIGDDGLKHTAAPADPHNEQHVEDAKEVQEFINIFSEINDLPQIEQDACKKADIDGESFLRLFDEGGSFPTVRFMQPEHIWGLNDNDPTTSFGINTTANDVNHIISYEYRPSGGLADTVVSASEVIHVKYNVIEGKRGIPTYYPVEGNLRRVESLQASMTQMAKVRAKIAMVVQMTGVASEQAQNMVNRLTQIRIKDPNSNMQHSVEQLLDGTIYRLGGNQQVTFPPHNIGASDFVEVLQSELRAIAGRLQMTEWMFTALADAKYSNALVAEAPSLRAFKKLQRIWCRNIGEYRYKWRASLIWKAIKMVVRSGLLSERMLYTVKVSTIGPPIETRNAKDDAELDEKYMKLGLKTKEQIQRDRGLDPSEEDKDRISIPIEYLDKITVISQNVKSGSITPSAGKVLIGLIAKLPEPMVDMLVGM